MEVVKEKETDSVADALARAEWQQVLFAERPQRATLLAFKPSWPCRPLRIRVHRNQVFEIIASTMAPFLAFAGLAAEYVYSDYDDSLSFQNLGDDEADLELVWIDYERYRQKSEPHALAAWMDDRLQALRAASHLPILVVDWAAEDDDAAAFNEAFNAHAAAQPGIYVCPQSAIAAALSERYIDPRGVAIHGSKLSNRAAIETARRMGLQWIPAVVSFGLKAIVVDLDGTLYQGVLGEDGPSGVQLTEKHTLLQNRLLELRDQGLFLAVASRNEPADVEQLFTTRTDFPLRLSDFSSRAVSWGSKAEGIRRLADHLRIGIDAILFVDDNPGELAAAATALPGLKTLYAADVAETLKALDCYPGLMQWQISETDRLRLADLAASDERERMTQTQDRASYLRSLQVVVTLSMRPHDHLRRLHELVTKTNQFNLSLRRHAEAAIAEYLAAEDCRVAAIWLADRLSDSGLIGVMLTRLSEEGLIVEELCVSCRALGRHLEDIMIGEAIALILAELPAERVGFRWARGPRNGPALAWLERFANQPLPETGHPVWVDWATVYPPAGGERDAVSIQRAA